MPYTTAEALQSRVKLPVAVQLGMNEELVRVM